MEKTLQKISYWLVWGLFLTPCFFWFQGQNNLLLPKGYLAKIIIELLFVSYLLLLSKNKQYTIKWNILNLSFLSYIVISFCVSLWGVDFSHSFWGSPDRFLGIFDLLHFFILLIILPSILKNKENWIKFLKPLITTYLCISGVFYLSYIFNIFSLAKINPEIGRWTGFAGNSIYMAVFILINIFLSFFLFFEDIENNKKTLKFLMFALLFIFLLFATGSRGVILSCFACLFIFLIIFSLKKHTKFNSLFHINNQKWSLIALLILISFSGIVFSFRNSKLIQKISPLRRLASISIDDISTANRIIIAKTSIQAFLQRKTLGWGANNYDIAYQNNFNPNIVKISPQEFRFDKAHNMFLEVAVCTGIIGLISYLVFFIIGYRSIKQINELEFFPKLILMLLILSYLIQNLFFFDIFDGFLPLILLFSFISTLIQKHYIIRKHWLIYPLIVLTLFSLYQFNIKELVYLNGLASFNSVNRETLIFKELDAVSKMEYPYNNIDKEKINNITQYLNTNLNKYPNRWRPYLAGFYFILLQSQISKNHTIPTNLVTEAKKLYLIANNHHLVLPDIERLYLKILKYSDDPQDNIMYNQNYLRLIQTYPNINWDK